MLSLTVEQIAEFEELGFLHVRAVFSPDEIEEMAAAFERLAQRATEIEETALVDGSQFVVTGRTIHRVVWCGAAEEVLSEFGRDPRLLAMVSQLLGSSTMEQLINQAHFKFPGDGVAFAWHQDSRHRRYGTDLWTDVNERGSFIETATVIDEMREDNGPLRFIVGSHKRGHIETLTPEKELPPEVLDARRMVTVLAEPGDVVLFGPYVIHSSPPNRSTTPRRLFLNGFACPGANRRVYPGEGAGRVVECGS